MVKKKVSKPLVVRSTAVHTAVAGEVAGLVNPFDDSARDSKLYDSNAARTFTFQSRQIQTMECNFNGMGYNQYYPYIRQFQRGVDMTTDAFLPPSGVLSGTATFTGLNVTDYTSLTGNGHKYRVCSWGLRVTCTDPALSAQGRLLIRELDDEGATANANTLALSDNYVSVPITHDMDYTIIPNHVAESYQEFRPMDALHSTELNDVAATPPFRCVSLSIVGADPSAATGTGRAILSVEVVYNLEIQPAIGTIGMRLSTPPAPHSHALTEAANNTRTNVSLVHKTPSVWSTIKRAATSALKSVGNYALGRLTGGLSDILSNKADQLNMAIRQVKGGQPLLLTN